MRRPRRAARTGGPGRPGAPARAVAALCAAIAAWPACDAPAPDALSTDGLTPPARRVRRLSSREYDNVVRDLFGDGSRPAARFPADVSPSGYDNGAAGLAVQADRVLDYQQAAEAVAARAVAGDLRRLIGGCDPVRDGPGVCLDALLSTLAGRAFRRPLRAGERARLRAVFAIETAGGGDFHRGLQTVLEAILQSPQFLYREELGPDTGGGARVALTDYEVASELSFLLTGSIPDDALWAAAGAGRLRTRADRRREAARLLASGAATETLRAFLHRWLATDRLPVLTKDHRRYPDFSRALAASMAGELDRLYGLVLSPTEPGSLRMLLTDPRGFVDPRLARLYGADAPASGFAAVTLDPAVRPGVLTRAGFLAEHAASDSSGPVPRGVFVLQSLLCAPPPAPPPDVPAPPPPDDPEVRGLTTRQRFERHLSAAACAGCHRQIDGVGFGFESFDGIGALRRTEEGQPVDDRGQLVGGGSADGPFRGAAELARRLAASEKVQDCFLRQAYRYAMGQIEPAEDDLRRLMPAFDSDARLTDVLLALLDSPIFTVRAAEAAGAP